MRCFPTLWVWTSTQNSLWQENTTSRLLGITRFSFKNHPCTGQVVRCHTSQYSYKEVQDQRKSLTILLLFPAKSVLWVLLESLLYSVQTIQRLLFGIITVTYEAILSRSHNAQSITNQSGNYMFLKFKQSTIASPTTILTNDFKTIWSLIQHTLLYKECHFKEHKHTTLLHNNNIHNHHMHLSKLHDLNKNSSYWKSLIVL